MPTAETTRVTGCPTLLEPGEGSEWQRGERERGRGRERERESECVHVCHQACAYMIVAGTTLLKHVNHTPEGNKQQLIRGEKQADSAANRTVTTEQTNQQTRHTHTNKQHNRAYTLQQ